jgi:hypothetical protein
MDQGRARVNRRPEDPADDPVAGHGFDAWDADTDRAVSAHFAAVLARPGRTVEQFWPAYRFGWDLGHEGPGDWAALEPRVRQKWETGQLGSWEEFREAAPCAFELARGRRRFSA